MTRPVHYAAPANLPRGMPLSAAVAHRGILYVSGLPGRDAAGEIPSDFASQFRNAIALMDGLVRQAGATLDDMIETSVLLTRAEDVAEMNRIYAASFSAPYPARITSIVAALPHPDLLVEIRGTAALPDEA